MATDIETSRLAALTRLHGERSTAVFRVLLDAIAHPGRPRRLPAEVCTPGVPSALLLPLALADLGSSLAVRGTVGVAAGEPLQRMVCLATAARPAPLDTAGFVVCLDGVAGVVDRLCAGSDEHPEAATKFAVQVDDLDRGDRIELDGPGIAAPFVTTLGLEAAFVAALAQRNARPPIGVDTWVFDDHQRVLALPRSTRLSLVDTLAPHSEVS